VVWTDAFQMVVMVAGFLTVLIQGANRAGGIETVWRTAHEGGRLEVFEYVCVQTLNLLVILFISLLYTLYTLYHYMSLLIYDSPFSPPGRHLTDALGSILTMLQYLTL